jgi:hypothetical protein
VHEVVMRITCARPGPCQLYLAPVALTHSHVVCLVRQGELISACLQHIWGSKGVGLVIAQYH